MRDEGSQVQVIACHYCPSGLIGGFFNPIGPKQNLGIPLEIVNISPCKLHDLHRQLAKTRVNLSFGGKQIIFKVLQRQRL